MERVRKSIRLLLTCTLTYSCLFWLAIMLIPQVFVGIFTSDPELTETAVWAARIFLFGVFSFGAQVGFQQSFLALGQAKASLLMGVLRKIVLEIPALCILNMIFPLYGLTYAQFTAEVVLAITAVFILRRLFRKFEKQYPQAAA